MKAKASARFAPENVFEQVRSRLKLMEGRQDLRLSSSESASESAQLLCPAAVLIGLAAYPDEVMVILTQRTSALRVHSGQIAFPGGKIDMRDETPAAAALREAHEEIGLDASQAEPLGYLDPYVTGTGFCIIPVVAKVATPITFKINPDEVDEVFEVPFAFLMDPANHALRHKEIEGKVRHFHAMPYGPRNIWGVTAGILRNLYERLYC
jgi:8-oxo-dGTP pyrophosphatase MutT (NUDIX family)